MRQYGRLFGMILFAGLVGFQASRNVSAQTFSQTARPFVQSIEALGMGDAVAAVPSPYTAFFYNPAHFAYLPPFRPIINVVGVRTVINPNIVNQIRYYRNDLEPAIDEGLDNLPPAEVSRLYDRALELGRRRTFLNVAALGPAVMLNAGPVGVGGGLFGNSYVRYRFSDAGAGIPRIEMVGIADALVAFGGGMRLGDLGLRDVALGVNARFIQRYATTKNKPVDIIEADEPIHIFSARTASFDIGILAELRFFRYIPGRFQFGATVFDLAPRKFSFKLNQTWYETAVNPALVDFERTRIQEKLNISPGYRIGLAYVLPSALDVFKESSVAIDYVGFADPLVEQVFLAHLHIGLQLNMPFMAIRLGFNQGYPTAGMGFSFGFIRLNYAYYGIEEGRLPGQAPGWNHALQISLGMF